MANDLPKAEQALRKAMKPECSAMLDFTLGSIDFQQDKLPEAQANYEKAVAKFPSFRRAWRNLGLIHVRNGKYDDSIHAFMRMIELGGATAMPSDCWASPTPPSRTSRRPRRPTAARCSCSPTAPSGDWA